VHQYSILVVDDEESALTALERALRREYNVFSATNGEDALAIMEQNDIHLVIADYRMPGMTGVEFLEKTLQDHPRTIRVILTAYTNEQLLTDAINIVNAHGFLTKPWDTDEVKSLVKKWEKAETKRKRAEEDLRESQKYAQSLIHSSLDMIIAVDRDRNIIEFNKAAQETFGYSQEEAIGKDIAILYSDPEQGSKINDAVRKTGQFTGEVVNRRRNGSVFPSFVSASVLRDAKDRFIGVMGISRDITKREQMKDELVRVQSLDAIGVLAGGIAHDFNNILTGILGNISLAKIYTEPDRISERLTEADRACVKARELVQHLLTFSKGGAPIKKVASVARLLRGSVAFALSGSNVKCEFSISDDLWPAEIDEAQINQVMNNVIINADQAMPDGGKIEVSASNLNIEENAPGLQPGPYIKLSIADQGIGISEEHMQKIFDLFFTTKKRGRGLGLATTYSIVKKHNGHIAVESRIGMGTTFHIYLPASPEESPVQKEEAEGRPIKGEGRILVMDDEKHIRDLAAEMLYSIGYRVTTTIDGNEALDLYKEAMDSGQSYDAVIIDLTIPGGMGGKETIRNLLKIDPEAKAIVSSGYSNDPIMADSREYGFKGVIAKPYKVKQLSKVLHEVIASQL